LLDVSYAFMPPLHLQCCGIQVPFSVGGRLAEGVEASRESIVERLEGNARGEGLPKAARRNRKLRCRARAAGSSGEPPAMFSVLSQGLSRAASTKQPPRSIFEFYPFTSTYSPKFRGFKKLTEGDLFFMKSAILGIRSPSCILRKVRCWCSTLLVWSQTKLNGVLPSILFIRIHCIAASTEFRWLFAVNRFECS